MNFAVHTQTLENYGAHAEDGKFLSNNHYWKMKGGDTYIVSGLDRIQDAVAFVAAIAMENGIAWKEFPCDWSTEEEWVANMADDSNDETDENDGESDDEMIVPPDYVYPASFEDG